MNAATLAHSIHGFCRCEYDGLQRGRKIEPAQIQEMEEVFCLFREIDLPPNAGSEDLIMRSFWPFDPTQLGKAISQETIWFARLYQNYFGLFQPFDWVDTENMGKNKYLVELYLEAGGNPNLQGRRGKSPLVEAVLFIIDFLHRRTPNKELSSGEMSKCLLTDAPISGGQDAEDEDYQQCVRLLVLLIAAGAYIYEVVFYGGIKMLTKLASESGIRNMWETALEECGFDVQDVYAESDRRMRKFRRLRGAERTGIDVEVPQENDSSIGLRYRGRRKVTDT